MDEVIEFLKRYKYPIIGAIIAILILKFELLEFIGIIAVILLGIYLGFYFQKNKEEIKEKIKSFIDKL